MGVMIDGVWRRDGDFARDTQGRFLRAEAGFRDWVTADGAPGPAGEGGFRAEPGRYHLYVSLACPWAHRALIFRALKGLTKIVGLSVVNWHMGEDGWTFAPGQGVIADPVMGAEQLWRLYALSRPNYTGRVSVPILFDTARRRIVNNESSEIIRMFNSAFDRVGATGDDFYPLELRPEIDALNARIYATVNNGVYRCGFAQTQTAYDEAVAALFDTLDWLEARLADRRNLCGERLTEADWRLFTTLVRFDPVYVGLFKCNLRRLADYPRLSRYFAELRAVPGVAETIDYFHIKHHYYGSLLTINPTGIVPMGPAGFE